MYERRTFWDLKGAFLNCQDSISSTRLSIRSLFVFAYLHIGIYICTITSFLHCTVHASNVESLINFYIYIVCNRACH